MKLSVAALKAINKALEDRCIITVTDKEHLKNKTDLAPWSPDVLAYKVQ